MIEHTIILPRNMAYIAIKQSPTLEEFLHAGRLFINDPAYRADLHRLCDFSQADLSHITAGDFMAFVEFAITEITLSPEARVALVAPDADKRGIFERFANQVDTGIFRIFLEPDEALRWITRAPGDSDIPGP